MKRKFFFTKNFLFIELFELLFTAKQNIKKKNQYLKEFFLFSN